MLFLRCQIIIHRKKNVVNNFNIIIKMGSGSLLIIPWTLKEEGKKGVLSTTTYAEIL